MSHRILIPKVIFLIIIIVSTFSLIKAQDCYTPKWAPGFCANLRYCESVLQQILLYNQNGDPSIVTYLQNSICGYDGFDMMVCCPNQTLTTAPPPPPQPLQFQTNPTKAPSGGVPLPGYTFAPIINAVPPSSLQTPENPWNRPQTFAPIQFTSMAPGSATATASPSPATPSHTQFPTPKPAVFPTNPVPSINTQLPTFERNQCGMSNATHSRVVGGLPAQVNSWPWIALVGYRNTFDDISGKSSPRFLCGGTLITQRHVLTAAHCIKDSLYMVRLGEHDLTTDSDSPTHDIPVDLKIVHEHFNSKIIYSDIALLRLTHEAPFNDQIRPICLPLSDELRDRDYTFYQPFLAGWGATTYRGNQATVLQEVQLPILPIQDCETAYKAHFPEQIFDEKVMCVGFMSGGKDSCQGDSGGPLMLPQKSLDQSYYYFNLLGIVSYGYECARPGFPGIYTRVTAFIPWILQHVND